MQLKLKRSQREAGVLSTNVIFCLDARVEFTREEQHSVTRYKLQNQIIYTSEGARRAAEGSSVSAANAKARARGIGLNSVDDFLTATTGSIGHGLKAAALGALSAMRLTITINSLQRGQHIECKSLDELLGAEDAIMTACQNLRGYLTTAASFDGREVLVDFSEDEPKVVAQAASPNPQLIAPLPPGAMSLPPQAALPSPTEDAEFDDVTEPSDDSTTSYAESYPSHEMGFLDGLPFDINDPQTQQRLVVVGIIVLVVLAWLMSH